MSEEVDLFEPAGVGHLLQRPGPAPLAALLQTQHVGTEARKRVYNSIEPAPALHVVGDDPQCSCGGHTCCDASMASMRTARPCSTEAASLRCPEGQRDQFLQPYKSGGAFFDQLGRARRETH